MLINIIKNSFINQKKSMLLMISSVAVGTAVAASLITLSYEITGKVSKELRSFGANIMVKPAIEGLADITGQNRYLNESDIIKVKTIFWRHNILGISPFLYSDDIISHNKKSVKARLAGAWFSKQLPVPGDEDTFTAGIISVSPWWNLNGKWPLNMNEIASGITLAQRLGLAIGDSLIIRDREMKVTGIIDTGGNEDNYAFMELDQLQALTGLNGKISMALVSALTRPMDDFAYKDPETMTQTEYEKWYCTGYVTSIAKQVEEVFTGSSAKPIWRVAETEGKVLNKLQILTYLLCVIALIASALGVSTTMVMSLLRRTEEIGLMKAIGATRASIVSIFLAEGFVIGIIGGLIGYVVSLFVSRYIGIYVFNTALQQKDYLMLIAIGSAVLISLGGTILPVKKAVNIKPSIVLKEAK